MNNMLKHFCTTKLTIMKRSNYRVSITDDMLPSKVDLIFYEGLEKINKYR